MLLSEILKDIDCTTLGDDIEISSIEYDSRKVTKGALFVAIKGFGTDGHLYIEKAIENGAAAILAEEYDKKVKVPIIKTQDTRKGLAIASANFYGNSAKRLKIIGVTGTNGKTTITYLIKQVFDLLGIKSGLIGTNQNIIGDEILKAERTTPESAQLHEIFKEMEDKGVTHVIMEVSSHSLELHRTYGIEFEVGVFTNLTQDHLDFHKDMDSYMKAKALLFKSSKKAVINKDDKYSDEIIKAATCPVLTYGIDNECDLKAENIRISERGVIFFVDGQDTENEVRLGIPGKFSVYNALAAVGACLSLGISMDDIIKGLILAKGVKGRAEVVQIPAPYTVLIDYAHTPDGLENIISTVKEFAKGRVITLFGCGGDRDKTKRPIMGETAGRLSDFCIVTSDNPRSEKPSEIINDIVEGMKNIKDKYKIVENRKEAIKYVMSIAKEGDVIILAGKGHETYQILKDKTIDFDERDIVKEIFLSS